MIDALHGVIVPTLTPFQDGGALDVAAVATLVDYLVERGVHGLFAGGTTGEGFLLSLEERRRLAEVTVTAAAGRIPVIIQTGTPTTADTLALTRHAHEAGADAAAILPPYVYHHSSAALLRHYTTVAQSVPDLPILLYNFPAISNNALTFDLIMEMRSQAPNIVGMKDSSGSLETLVRLKTATDGAFLAFNGGDGQVLMGLAMGLDGCVSGNANVTPELLVALYDATVSGDLAQARRLQLTLNQVRDLLGDGGNLSLFKRMIARRGVDVGDVRPPLLPAEEALVDERWRRLAALDVFDRA